MMRALGVISFLALVGCFQRPMTPPSTAAVLASPATLDKRRVAVGVNAGVHGSVFGPTVVAAAGRVRYGLRPAVELVGDAGAYVLTDDGVADEHRGLYTGRLGLKLGVHEHIALFGGLGAGVAPAFGFFGGVDVGFIVGYENIHAVPFLAGRLAFNGPVRPSTVDTGRAGHDMLGEVVAAPARTLVTTVEIGVRIPVGPWLDARRRRFQLLGALVVTHLYDGRGGVVQDADGVAALGASFGLEMALPE